MNTPLEEDVATIRGFLAAMHKRRRIANISVVEAALDRLAAAPSLPQPTGEDAVDFYEREFYPLSNFSSFSLMWEVSPLEGRMRFDTSEAVYHFEKFIKRGRIPTMQQVRLAHRIRTAPSAHEAFKLAEVNRHLRRDDWDEIKVDVMRRIIRAKAEQHEYVRRKLLETGDRPLIEGSWRDDFWGIGPNRDGQNMLGKLWMELRAELQGAKS